VAEENRQAPRWLTPFLYTGAVSPARKEGNMVYDRELAKKCAFDARALLNDMQGNGHIDELKLLKAMQLLVNAVQALAAQK
jgi:hypothetical protein